jgi:hypothetical protein
MARIPSRDALAERLDAIVAEALGREANRLKRSVNDAGERAEKLNAVRSKLVRWRERAEADLLRNAHQP